MTTGQEVDTRLQPGTDTMVTSAIGYGVIDAEYGSAIVELIREVAPHIPIPVARSLAVEVVDRARAGAAWAERRAGVDKQVLRASYNRHAGHTYSERRARELTNAAPREGDYQGRQEVA
jgi:short subunit dehydrogenase-like uncharacterized protein